MRVLRVVKQETRDGETWMHLRPKTSDKNKGVVHESVNASKRRLLASGFQLPSFASVKACPHLVFDGNLADSVSIFGLDGEIEIVAANEPMHAKLKRSIDRGIDFPGSAFH